MTALVLIIVAILIGVLLWQNRRAQKVQQQELARMRRNSKEQARAILMLNQSLAGTARQVNEMSKRQDRLRNTLDSRMDAMQQSNENKLDKMRETVSEKLNAHLAESFSSVSKQLADVHRGLGEMHELAGEFSSLKRVLGGVKTRGIWGEMQLRALLEQMLSPGQYIENAAIPANSQTRVEFAVRLPASDGEALLPIDSKFPQEDFIRLMDAIESGDPKNIELCSAKLERALAEQAKAISEKYIRPPQTADFAVMFLPVESLYAEAVRRDGLCERLQNQYRVLVAGPNTLAALLTSLRMGFRTVTLERRSGEVLKLLSDVRNDFARYEEAAATVRKRLDQTREALDILDQRAKRISHHLREISEEDAEE